MKKIAILGKPNVGKSSLFNRLAKQRIAVTSDIKGTTRDINQATMVISGNKIEIIDTGGIEDTKHEIFSKVRENSLLAAKKADLVLYVVDGKEIPNDKDKSLIYEISKHTICFLIINKIDNDLQKEFGYAFFQFGIKNIFFISVIHNRGISILINAIYTTLFPQNTKLLEQDLLENLEKMTQLSEVHENQEIVSNQVINIGIIGRVNVGKSSLLNALLGKNRSIVSSIEGTTIDPVEDTIQVNDKTLRFIDTAGIRRRSKIEGIEKYALERTNKILELSDIVILVLDSSKPIVELDEKISSVVQKYQLGIIVAFNKWDIKHADFKKIKAEFMHKFNFLEWAPFITLSAKNKRHINELKQKILEVYNNYSFRIPTAKLNESILNAQKIHPIPSDRGRIIKIYYATQYKSNPPQIALILNYPSSLHFSYKRFLINQLRREFNLFGTPIILIPRSKPKQKIVSD